MADRYVAPTGLGKKDGSSMDDAADFKAIDPQIKLAGPGGRVMLRADKGDYHGTYIGIASSGEPGRPVTIKGFDDRPVTFSGSRASPYSPTADRGKPLFQVKDGASNLNFVGFIAKNIGDGLLFFTGQHKNISIRMIKGYNVRQLIKIKKNESGVPNASMDNFLIEKILVTGHSKAAIELWNATNGNITEVQLDSQKQDGDPYCFGLFADGLCSDVMVRLFSAKNIQFTDKPDKYWNGDGVSVEGACKNFTFEDGVMDSIEDAGYDLKGTGHIVRRCKVNKVKRGVRAWKDVTIEDFVATNLVKRGGIGGRATVWVAGGATVNATKLVSDPTQLRFDTSDGHCTVNDAG